MALPDTITWQEERKKEQQAPPVTWWPTTPRTMPDRVIPTVTFNPTPRTMPDRVIPPSPYTRPVEPPKVTTYPQNYMQPKAVKPEYQPDTFNWTSPGPLQGQPITYGPRNLPDVAAENYYNYEPLTYKDFTKQRRMQRPLTYMNAAGQPIHNPDYYEWLAKYSQWAEDIYPQWAQAQAMTGQWYQGRRIPGNSVNSVNAVDRLVANVDAIMQKEKAKQAAAGGTGGYAPKATSNWPGGGGGGGGDAEKKYYLDMMVWKI